MEYVYAALILHKLGKDISEGNLKKVLEAAGAKVDEGKIKALVSALKDVDIEKELKEASVAPVAASAGVPKEAKKEEKKEEEDDKKSEEQAAAGLGSLFG